jgi:hypothetical protein
MRKRVITPIPQSIYPHDESWLALDRVASVEVTSEEKDYGIDSALVSGQTRGWRAASPGTQTIRLLFDQPQRLRLISLVFEENEIKHHPRVRLTMVCGWRTLVSRNCTPAVEFQPA